MLWIWYLLLLLAMVIGLFLTLLTLPGIWFMILSAAVYAWITGGQFIGLWTIIILVVIGLVSEVVEFLAGSVGATGAGGSTRAAVGAIIGGLLGAIFLSFIPIPIISTIIGACLGAFLGALLAEYTVDGRGGHSLAVGWGAAKGRFWGMLSKLLFGAVIFAIAIIAALPLPSRRRVAPLPPAPGMPATQPATAPAALPATAPTTAPATVTMSDHLPIDGGVPWA